MSYEEVLLNTFVRGEKSGYRIVRPIARGGMGSVWLARDLANDDEVVVKTPHPIPVAIKKLRFETQLLSSIKHPHIVGYRDTAELNRVPLLIEEFVEGVTLRKYVEQHGPLDEREFKARMEAILLALDYLHSRNIIHRDIKPQNIMVSNHIIDNVLIDLGTAVYYNVSGVNELVYSGGGYTAPEQYMGYALPQSDIWSVIAVGFYMLTGKDPISILHPYYPKNPVPGSLDQALTRLRPDVSPELARFIVKGLSWHVLDRFITAREAFDFLEGRIKEFKYPRFEVMGIPIPVKTRHLVFGRKIADTQKQYTTIEGDTQPQSIIMEEEKVIWYTDGDYTFVEVSDPYKWISRRHFEILNYESNKWCLRDLGSTNRTAIVTKRGIIEVWGGRGVVSNCYPLDNSVLILIAYGNSLRNPPYVTAFFSYS